MSLKDLLSRLANHRSSPRISLQAHTPDVELIPDFIEPLVGWRVWKVWRPSAKSESCPGLTGIILNTPWSPRRKISADHNFDLAAKCRGLLESGCSCGVYAFREPDDAFCYAMKVRDRLLGITNEVALGEVSLWGRVIECERGYRAQYAYPRHIYLPASFARYISEVGSAFGVPTGIYAPPCDEEIHAMALGRYNKLKTQMLLLKRSELFGLDVVPCEVAFYDPAPISA